MTVIILKQKINFPKNRGALMEPLKLTEPHSMFCGTPALDESADWALLSLLCGDSNLHISVLKAFE